MIFFILIIHFQIEATSIGVALAASVKSSFRRAPMYRHGRKYMCSTHHLFLIRLNVVTGSSNQPCAFTHFFFL